MGNEGTNPNGANCSESQITERNDPELKELRERFVRWQAASMQQMTFVNNLIIVLSVAILGFMIDKADVFVGYLCECRCWLVIASVIVFISIWGSLIFGVLTAISRLKDIRATKDIAKLKKNRRKKEIAIINKETAENQEEIAIINKETAENQEEIAIINKEINTKRDIVKQQGILSWKLLYMQIGTFLAGLVIYLLGIYVNVISTLIFQHIR